MALITKTSPTFTSKELIDMGYTATAAAMHPALADRKPVISTHELVRQGYPFKVAQNHPHNAEAPVQQNVLSDSQREVLQETARLALSTQTPKLLSQEHTTA